MTEAVSRFGLARQAGPPSWWTAWARFIWGDDKPHPAEGRAHEQKAAESEVVDQEPGPDLGEDLGAFWRGDDPTVEAIYRAHARRLLGVARSIVGPAEAESVVHEVFVELIRNQELRRRFTGGSLGARLGAIARLKSLEHLRRTGRTVPGAASWPTTSLLLPSPSRSSRREISCCAS